MRLLELEGNGMLEITETDPGNDLLVKLDRNRIKTDGKRIIGLYESCFLNNLLTFACVFQYKLWPVIGTSNFQSRLGVLGIDGRPG